MNELVAIGFRLINFAVAVAVACYVFKRYLVPVIVAENDRRQKEINILHAKTVESAKKEKDAKQAISDQRLFHQKLNKKLEQWNTVFNAAVVHRNREKQYIIDLLAQKAVQQENYIVMHHAQKQVMPIAIADAQELLMKKFTSSDIAQSYIENLITHMRRIS